MRGRKKKKKRSEREREREIIECGKRDRGQEG